MPKVTKQQKVVLAGMAGAILLVILYRRYVASKAQAQQAGTGISPQDQAASDYAALAGQEQSDIAALAASQQQDVGDLTSLITGVGAQEAQDVATLTGTESADIAGLAGDISSLQGDIGGLGARMDAMVQTAAGVKPAARTPTSKQKGVGGLPKAAGKTLAKQIHWLKTAAGKEWRRHHPKWEKSHPKTVRAAGGAVAHKPVAHTAVAPHRVIHHSSAARPVRHVTAHQASMPAHHAGHAGAAVAARSHVQRPGVSGPGKSVIMDRATAPRITEHKANDAGTAPVKTPYSDPQYPMYKKSG